MTRGKVATPRVRLAPRAQTPTSWAMELPGAESAVSTARAWAARVLSPDPDVEHPHAYAATLIVSELVTNAVLHSASGEGGRILVRLETWADGAVKVSVLDQGARVTVRVPPDPDEHCRGLVIVEALAAEYGQTVTDTGRRIWALIA